MLFASTRPDYADLALRNLQWSLAGEDFEIVCVAPFEIRGEKIVYVAEPESRGCYPAYRQALSASRGDVFAFFTDDMVAIPGWAHRLADELAAAEAHHFPFVGGLRPVNWPLCHSMYGRYFANWPVFTRRTITTISEPFGDEFPHHFGDCDFALRVWEAGGRVDLLSHRKIFVLMENPVRPSSPFAPTTGVQPAFEKFKAKWAPRFGRPTDEPVSAVAGRHPIADG